MARVFIDGFESGDFSLWDGTIGNVSVQNATILTGAYSAKLNGGNNLGQSFQRSIPQASTYYAGFHFKPLGYGYAYPSGVFELAYSTTSQINIRYGTDNYLHLYRGNTWLAYSSPTQIAPNSVNHIQVYAYIDDTSGRVVVKINGLTCIDFTGDTKNHATSNLIDRVVFGVQGVQPTPMIVDDFILDDANYPGQSFIAGIMPNGAGYSTQWDPSTGANYACVDEVPYSDTDFISTNVVDEVDTYAMGDLPSEAAVVKCVQVHARARIEGAATPQNLNLAVRTTGGDAYSADQALQTAFAEHYKIWETNPGTSNPWTISEVNAMEAGVKSKT